MTAHATESALCPFELEILQELAGLKEERPWGAAVGVARNYLKRSGYTDAFGKLTPRGQAALPPANDP